MDLPINYNTATWQERKAARLQYIEQQGGDCYHCKMPLKGPPRIDVLLLKINWRLFPGGEQGFLKYPVHLHHNHSTGKTIGAVHALCNAVLWQYHNE